VSADAAAPKRAAKLPRGVCFVCGLEYALRSNGLVRKHSAGVLCQSGEHNHAACISRYGLLATPYTSPHELPDCQGSGWLPNPQGGGWLVSVEYQMGTKLIWAFRTGCQKLIMKASICPVAGMLFGQCSSQCRRLMSGLMVWWAGGWCAIGVL
jgi:hypothetical protein